jgi:hypothetical protein
MYLSGLILAGVLLMVILSIPSCQKPVVTPQQTFNEVLAIAQKPLLAQIEDQKRQVADFKSRLSVSDAKYKTLVDKYVDLERRKNEVKPPTTNKELRDRFVALDFAPLPIK